MRPWSFAVAGGALALACGASSDGLFDGAPDSSAGTGGTSASGGSNGNAGSGGSSGSGGSGGSGGSSDAAGDSGGTSSDAGGDSPTDGGSGDSSGGSGGATGSGGTSGGTGGGVGIGGPGQVVCGNAACDLSFAQCCVGFPILGCQGRFPPICLASVQLNCDDALDCENGETCCATLAGSVPTGANCQAACDNGVVFCNDSTRCPTGTTCQPFAGLDNYRACAP